MLTPGERILLERLLELHPSDKAFDLFEMMRSEKPNEEIPTYYFSNPDPYFAREPLPPDHTDHEKRCDEFGTLHVQNLSANELPEITLTKEISGTVYSVTGSYIAIWVLKENERAIAFYKRYGFQFDGHQGMTQIGATAVRMRLER